MVADPDAYMRLLDDVPVTRPRAQPRAWYVAAPKSLLWKTVLLAVTTLAFVPILLMKHELAGAIYVAALVAVHVVGLIAIVAKSGGWWQDKRGLMWRLGGIAILSVLLSIAGKGLVGATGLLFWGTLGLVWLLHAAGAVLFHIRGDPRACPFF